MKSNEVGNKIGVFAFIVWLLLCGVDFWITKKNPPYVETVVNLSNPYLCINKGAEWIKVEKFAIDDNFFICGIIKSNKTDLHTQVQIRVYENELSSMVNAIYHDNQWISAGDQQIPIRTYLFAGTYVAQVNIGRKTISIIEFEVIEN
jgi:hypothetical protein